jgi:hypothetical protein
LQLPLPDKAETSPDDCSPEKAQAKQLHALAKLFELHPAYRTGKDRVDLTLMGGVRDAGDQGRLDALNRLAEELGIQVSTLSLGIYPA